MAHTQWAPGPRGPFAGDFPRPDGDLGRRDTRDDPDGASLAGGSLRSAYGDSGPDHVEGDGDAIVSAVADAIEQLRAGSGSGGAAALGPAAKEEVVAELAQLAEASAEARSAIGFHAQGIPLLVGLLRSGTMGARTCAAATLGALCEQEELRVKVLLGGCIPPLLGLLRQGPQDAQLEAAEALHAVSRVALAPAPSSRDSVGTRIFATEGVVPALLALLQPGVGAQGEGAEDVREVLTATLRNLAAGSLPNFWRAVEREGGLPIFTQMLSSARPAAQENAAALLASYLTAPPPASHALVPLKGGAPAKGGGPPEAAAEQLVHSGTIPVLLSLMAPGREVAVRTEAAGVLRAATEASEVARQAVAEQGGVPVLIRAVVAPAQEMMTSGHAQRLQENAMAALTHVAGGPRAVVAFLASRVEQCREEQEQELAEHMGALAFALLVLHEEEDRGQAPAQELQEEGALGAPGIEQSLVRHLGPQAVALVQERAIECLGSLYACRWASSSVALPEAKRMLIGLITLAGPEGQGELIAVYRSVCVGEQSLWSALHGRDGVLQLVGLLGLSTEEQQECACALLRCLTEDAEESKWAITAAGGIPPLVQLLGTGTPRTRQDAALLLGNLCECNEDIRACVESAEAIPALLHLLASPAPEAQAAAAATLPRVVPATGATPEALGLLTELLLAEGPAPKGHAVQVLAQMLARAPDLAHEGAPSYEALHTLLLLLEAEGEDTQASAAAALASLLEARGELCASAAAAEAVPPLMQLVDRPASPAALPAARALAAVFSCVDGSYNAAEAAKESLYPLLKLARCEAPGVAELAAHALGSVLRSEELAVFAPVEDVVGVLTRLLREGSAGGQRDAAVGLACLMQARASDEELAESVGQHSTVLALVALLPGPGAPEEGPSREAADAALSCLWVLARHKGTASFSTSPLHVLAEAPFSLGPLVSVLAQGGQQEGPGAAAAEQAVEVLSRLCKDQPVVLGDLIAGTASCSAALAARVIRPGASLEVRVGATALLICAAKEHRQSTVEALGAAGLFEPLVGRLVEMLEARGEHEGTAPAVGGPEEDPGAGVLVKSVALWLLSLLASQSADARDAVASAGAVLLLVQRLGALASQAEAGLGCGADGEGEGEGEDEGEEGGSAWVSSLLLSILFCSRDVVRDPASQQAVPALVHLLAWRSPSGRYFAAQALASLVSNGSRGTLLGVVKAGGVGALLGAVGRLEEEDLSHLHALADDFGLPTLPEQAALEKLFRCDDKRIGAHCSAAIPELARLLQGHVEELHLQQHLQQHLHPHPNAQHLQEPHAGARGASQGAALVLGLLKQLAGVSRDNRVAMAAAGVVEGATKYLAAAPLQDGGEEAAVDLLRALLTAEEEVRQHAAVATAGVVERLLAVLQSEQRAARVKAAGALEGLFGVDAVKHSDAALLTLRPLLAMLQGACLQAHPEADPGHALEARAAAGAVAKLAFRSSARFLAVAEQLGVFSLLLELLQRQDLREDAREAAAVLGQGLFSTPTARARPEATLVVAPLVAMLSLEGGGTRPSLQLRAAGALDMLTEDEAVAEAVAGAGAVGPLVALLEAERPALATSAVSCLFKLARDRRSCKLDMAQGGAVERLLALLPAAPLPLAALAAELLRVLTNNGAIARSPAAARLVGPLFWLLARHGAELGVPAQTSVLQTLVNVVDKPGRLEAEGLAGADCMGALLPLLGSPSLLVLQLAVGLLAHLLSADSLAADPAVARAAGPLLSLVGPGQEVEGLRVEALKALEAISGHWPSAVSEVGGSLEELARLVACAPAPVMLLAAGVLGNVLRGASVRVAQRVPLPLYIRLLLCPLEGVQLVAVQALLALLEAEAGSSSGEAGAGAGDAVALLCKAGLVEALVEVLRQHPPRVEEAAARLLEAVFNSQRVRSSPAVLRAIGPLAAYLLDPLSVDPSAKLLAALALGDLFQENSAVVQQSQQGDLTAVCQALLALLRDTSGSSEDLHMVALCGLQNLTQHSRTNKRAVADAGGLARVMEMLPTASPALTQQAAALVRTLLNNNTLHDHATPQLLTSLTAVLERDLGGEDPQAQPGEGRAGGGAGAEEVLQAIEGLLHSFPRLRGSESATAAVPVLIAWMRCGSEAAQEMVLNVLWMLRQGWAQSKDAARLQSTAMGEAIPLLQLMLRSGPINLYEKAEALLCALPGCLMVCLRRGSNLKMGMGVTNAYCKLTLADAPPQLTKVIQNCTDPQWRHNFVWPLDAPPKGLTLHISCKNKGSLGTSSLGKASIPIDRTVALGLVSGTYALQPDTNRDGTQRSLDVEFSWTNRESANTAAPEAPGHAGQ